jgi:hypothetical protein
MSIAFIHVGKTGGTTINYLLLNVYNKNYIEYHHRRDYNANEKYILWIRNPIHRFVSAFNHSYYGIHTDTNTIKSFDFNNCLIPKRMENSIGRSYVFSKEYDKQFKEFRNANELAESLTSSNHILREKAIQLMSRPEEHLFKGLGWYLENGKFLKKKGQNILFVGKTETMKNDILKLSSILNVKLDVNIKLRENIYVDKSMKYLSPLAIQNIINWYENTDYATLKQLLNDGWIDKETLDSYYIYNN